MVGAAGCIVACLVASLVSTQQIQVAPFQVLTIENISKHCKMSPGNGGEEKLKSPLVETPWYGGETLLVLRRKVLKYLGLNFASAIYFRMV